MSLYVLEIQFASIWTDALSCENRNTESILQNHVQKATFDVAEDKITKILHIYMLVILNTMVLFTLK